MKHKKLLPKYSGVYSKGFWKRVNALKFKKDQHLAYVAACFLQDVEWRMLQILEHAEDLQRKEMPQ